MASLRDLLQLVGTTAKKDGDRLIIIRNYEGLPDFNSARDVDILVGESFVPHWLKRLSYVCSKLHTEFRIVEQCLDHVSIVISDIDGSDLEVDLVPAFVWYGIEWIKVDEVKHKVKHYTQDIWIPCASHECVINFCHSYLYGGFVKDKYLPLMSKQAKENREEVFDLLKIIFGRKTANEILDSLVNQDIGYISERATINRLKVLWRGFVRHPLRFIYTFCGGYLLEFRMKARGDNRPIQGNN